MTRDELIDRLRDPKVKLEGRELGEALNAWREWCIDFDEREAEKEANKSEYEL